MLSLILSAPKSMPCGLSLAMALSCILAIFAISKVDAELVIKPADIEGGRYVYKLERSDMKTLAPDSGKMPGWDWKPTGNKFFDDVYSFSNLRMTAGHWSFIQMQPGARMAEFVYRFDFSKTGRHPTLMSLREVVRHEQDGTAYDKRASTCFESFYRIGEKGEWMPLHSSSPDKGFRGDTVYRENSLKIIGAPAVVYYKVVFISDRPITGGYLKKDDPKGNAGRGGALWNFTRPDAPDQFFQVLFQTVPTGAAR